MVDRAAADVAGVIGGEATTTMLDTSWEKPHAHGRPDMTSRSANVAVSILLPPSVSRMCLFSGSPPGRGSPPHAHAMADAVDAERGET